MFLLLHPLYFLVAVYWSLGMILLLAYLAKTPGSTRQWSIMALLLFLPSIGWGRWRHDKQVRAGTMPLPPRSSFVWSAMGTLHALALLVHMLVWIATTISVWHVPDPLGPDSIANRTNNASAVGFDLMLSGFASMLDAMVLMAILFTHVFWFLLLSVLPWVVGGRIRRRYMERQLRELDRS